MLLQLHGLDLLGLHRRIRCIFLDLRGRRCREEDRDGSHIAGRRSSAEGHVAWRRSGRRPRRRKVSSSARRQVVGGGTNG